MSSKILSYPIATFIAVDDTMRFLFKFSSAIINPQWMTYLPLFPPPSPAVPFFSAVSWWFSSSEPTDLKEPSLLDRVTIWAAVFVTLFSMAQAMGRLFLFMEYTRTLTMRKVLVVWVIFFTSPFLLAFIFTALQLIITAVFYILYSAMYLLYVSTGLLVGLVEIALLLSLAMGWMILCVTVVAGFWTALEIYSEHGSQGFTPGIKQLFEEAKQLWRENNSTVALGFQKIIASLFMLGWILLGCIGDVPDGLL